MDVKKACLRLGFILLCVVLIIILVFTLAACNTYTYPTAVEQSWMYQIETTHLGPWVPLTTTTTTYLSYVEMTPLGGPPGTTVTVSFRNFRATMEVLVWFDNDDNSAYSVGEPSVSFLISFNPADLQNYPDRVELIVPAVSAGNYHIYVDIPRGSTIEFSFDFYVFGSPLVLILWVIGIVIVIIIVTTLVINNRITKSKTGKTQEKFEKGDIALKVNNVAGKIQVKTNTPLNADKAISFRFNKGAINQSIKVEGPLLRDGKEVK